MTRPRIDVVGLGPAGPELITAEALALLGGGAPVWLRTTRHPAAAGLAGVSSFDRVYESSDTFDEVYRTIVAELVASAARHGSVVYAVPGSPTVAERTVAMLGEDPAVTSGAVELVVHPSVSFLDVAFARLGVDPVAAGVRMVDGTSFAVDAAGERGPLLVAQCWSRLVLSDIKLSAELPGGTPVTVLHHLGLPGEQVSEVHWDDLDRTIEPDHLTSVWIPRMAAPVASELVALDELVRTLRSRCPWDREQTHSSLSRHLLEETYEVLEAIDEVDALDGRHSDGALDADAGADGPGPAAVAHLEEELGDLLFQVCFHAALATEAGRFTLADVARGVHDKLVARHPHVFGGAEAATSDEVAANWEQTKMAEKGRTSVTEGIPGALPALALAAKLQRKALAVGMVLPGVADEAAAVAEGVAALGRLHTGPADGADRGPAEPAEALGALLFSLTNVARMLGVEPETALRSRARAYRDEVEARG